MMLTCIPPPSPKYEGDEMKYYMYLCVLGDMGRWWVVVGGKGGIGGSGLSPLP